MDCRYSMNRGRALLPRLELPTPKNVLPLDSSMAFLASSSRVMPSASLMIFWVSVRLASSAGAGAGVFWLSPPVWAGGVLSWAGGLLPPPQAVRVNSMTRVRSSAEILFISVPPSVFSTKSGASKLRRLLILLYVTMEKKNRGQFCVFLGTSDIFVGFG